VFPASAFDLLSSQRQHLFLRFFLFFGLRVDFVRLEVDEESDSDQYSYADEDEDDPKEEDRACCQDGGGFGSEADELEGVRP